MPSPTTNRYSPEARDALAALDAALAYSAAAELAKTPEQKAREGIAGHLAAARRNLQLAKKDRAWRKGLAEQNPSALRFYGPRAPALLETVRRHRRAAQEGRRRLAAMQAGYALKMAAE